MKDPDRYDNLIYNQRPIAKKPMDPMKRAAQFSSFAALTGYEEQIDESARLTDAAVSLDEDEITLLNWKLQELRKIIAENPVVSVTYFVPDQDLHRNSRKDGGSYMTKTGIIKKIDDYEKSLIFSDGSRVLIPSIINMEYRYYLHL